MRSGTDWNAKVEGVVEVSTHKKVGVPPYFGRLCESVWGGCWWRCPSCGAWTLATTRDEILWEPRVYSKPQGNHILRRRRSRRLAGMLQPDRDGRMFRIRELRMGDTIPGWVNDFLIEHRCFENSLCPGKKFLTPDVLHTQEKRWLDEASKCQG